MNEDCTVKRCQQLKTNLNQHVPHIIQIIQILLKQENNQFKDPLLIKQQVLICFDRLINRLSILPLPSDLIDELFNYASSSWSIDALNCIHELILKQHIPKQYEIILHSSLRYVIQLILLINPSLSVIIVNKIIEILRSVFNLHLKRCESIEQYPMLELLTGLYKFTFQQVKLFLFFLLIFICYLDDTRWILCLFGYLVNFY